MSYTLVYHIKCIGYTLLTILLLASCNNKETEGPVPLGGIEGNVTIEGTNIPIPDIRVILDGPTSKSVSPTNDKGYFKVEGLEAGMYTLALEASSSFHPKESWTVRVKGGDTFSSDFSLAPKGSIRGRVTLAGQSIGIPGTEVQLRSKADNTELESKNTDSEGIFIFDKLLNGVYILELSHPNYELIEKEFSVSEGKETRADISMNPIVPVLKISTDALDFGTNIEVLTVDLSNEGKGELEWTVTGIPPWLTVNPTNDTTTTSISPISFTVNRSQLNTGTTTIVTIESNSGSKTIQVSVDVEPSISVFPSDLDFGTDNTRLTFKIKNIKSGTIAYSISVNQDWIKINPTEGNVSTEEDIIEVNIERSGLKFGRYPGEIIINAGAGNIRKVNLTMSILDPLAPFLDISQKELNFGRSDESKIITLSNLGSRPLTWQLNNSLPNWLRIIPTDGIIPAEGKSDAEINVVRAGLSAKTYEHPIKISSNGGDEDIIIKMEVTADPVLTISPDSLFFGNNESQKSFIISNTGNGELSWQLSSNQPWLSYTPLNGTNQGSVNVGIDRSKLPSGVGHSGQIDIQYNEGKKGKILIFVQNDRINEAPTASFIVSPNEGDISTIFKVDASESKDDVDILANLQVRWKWESSLPFGEWTYTKTATHTYTSPGEKRISLEIKDQQGEIDVISKVINVINLGFGDENEPNNDELESQDLQINSGTQGIVGELDDEADWFKIIPNANGLLQVRVENLSAKGTDNGNLDAVRVFNGDLEQLSRIYSDSYYSGGTNYFIGPEQKTTSPPIPIAKNQVYYLVVKPNTDSDVSTYEFLTIFTPYEMNDIQEPNNTDRNTGSIELGKSYTAFVGFGEDSEDWYEFTPQASGELEFEIHNLNPEDVEIGDLSTFDMYDSDLKLLTRISSASYYKGGNKYHIPPASKATSDKISVAANNSYYFHAKGELGYDLSHYQFQTFFEEYDISDIGEPNDKQRNAMMIELGMSYKGFVGLGEDHVDWYQFIPKENGKLEITIKNLNEEKSTQGDLAPFTLYNEEGTYLLRVYSNEYYSGGNRYNIPPNTQGISSYIPVAANTNYYLKIEGESGIDAAAYEFDTFFEKFTKDDFGEPNDVALSANLIYLDNTYTGLVGFGRDSQDWYKFNSDKNGRLIFSIENLSESTWIRGDMAPMELYDEADNYLTRVYTADYYNGGTKYHIPPGTKGKSSTIAIAANYTYYFKIAEEFTTDATLYQFNTEFTPFTENDFGEPNNKKSEASSVELNSEFTGFVGLANDNEDWYSFIPPQNGKLRFEIQNKNGSNEVRGDMAAAKLYDEDLNLLTQVYTEDYYNGGTKYHIPPNTSGESLSVPLSENETYFLNFSEEFEVDAALYQFETYFEPYLENDFGEPNNFFEDFTSIEVGNEYKGFVGFSQDNEDWYKFNSSENSSIIIEFFNLNESNTAKGDLAQVIIYDKNKNPIYYFRTNNYYQGGTKFNIPPGTGKRSDSISVNSNDEYYINVAPESSLDAGIYSIKVLPSN